MDDHNVDANKMLQQHLFTAANKHLSELFKIISFYQETTDKLFADYNLKVASTFMTRLLQSGKVKGNVKTMELRKTVPAGQGNTIENHQNPDSEKKND